MRDFKKDKIAEGTLTLGVLQDVANKLKRQMKHIFIVPSDHIPEDCYGILMVRKEDAPAWEEAMEFQKRIPMIDPIETREG